MDAVLGGIPPLVRPSDGRRRRRAAIAIMTTDRGQGAATPPGGLPVGAMGKGVGMISPSMATMLASSPPTPT